MAEVNVAADPSMDEILEKIQRMIATEGLNGHQPAVSRRPPAELPRKMSDEEELSGKHGKPVMPESEERLLSPATARATAAAFAQITAIRRQQGRSREFPIGGEQRTVEDVMRELLQPMMRDWLAEKLAPIIERLVRAELARALGEMGDP